MPRFLAALFLIALLTGCSTWVEDQTAELPPVDEPYPSPLAELEDDPPMDSALRDRPGLFDDEFGFDDEVGVDSDGVLY